MIRLPCLAPFPAPCFHPSAGGSAVPGKLSPDLVPHHLPNPYYVRRLELRSSTDIPATPLQDEVSYQDPAASSGRATPGDARLEPRNSSATGTEEWHLDSHPPWLMTLNVTNMLPRMCRMMALPDQSRWLLHVSETSFIGTVAAGGLVNAAASKRVPVDVGMIDFDSDFDSTSRLRF